jgi:hypothetical protein
MELTMNTKDETQAARRDSQPDSRRSQEACLDSCYGKIGISAVAAALPYQSDAKNPAYAPVIPNQAWWLTELAAA